MGGRADMLDKIADLPLLLHDTRNGYQRITNTVGIGQRGKRHADTLGQGSMNRLKRAEEAYAQPGLELHIPPVCQASDERVAQIAERIMGIALPTCSQRQTMVTTGITPQYSQQCYMQCVIKLRGQM